MMQTLCGTMALSALLRPPPPSTTFSTSLLRLPRLPSTAPRSGRRRAFPPRAPSAPHSQSRAALHATLSSPPPPQTQQRLHPGPQRRDAIHDVRYSRFLTLVGQRRVEKVTFNHEGTTLIGQLRPSKRRLWASARSRARTPSPPQRVRIRHLPDDPALLSTLTDHDVDVAVSPSVDPSARPRGLLSAAFRRLLLPLSLLAGLFFLLRRSAGASSPLTLARMSKSYEFRPRTNVTFADVAGCDGAKRELAEVVDFLKQPEAYTDMGCVVPRGVLLHGPPGTGKTLLAKAVAGEAEVPFVSISGSEFIEMYVGVGASRVRELFFQAKKKAPCIVFLDEIDAVGRQRGGNDEREQTINQILVEMDGYKGNSGVITIAATNRLDILDEALMRPGRFDRKVAVDLPDVQGRMRILSVHARGKPLETDVDLEAIARRTPGFSGAELENLMNEAALSAAREDKVTIGWMAIDGAHEAGHAICGALIPDYDQVQKISIVPRSNGAGGLTFFSPDMGRLESALYSKQYLESQLIVALGGRVAEELAFGEDSVTTGASSDLDHVAKIAKQMVKEYGMSKLVGPVALSSPSEGGPFMGRDLGRQRTPWGGKILGQVDSEVERLVNNAYVKTKRMLTENKGLLKHLARTLVENEVVMAEEFQMMLLLFDAKVCEYKIIGDDRNREQLPFQEFPKNV